MLLDEKSSHKFHKKRKFAYTVKTCLMAPAFFFTFIKMQLANN